MIRKKICMLGAFAVGKTSLVRRFVHSLYSDEYHTTIGVKVDKKTLLVDERELALVLWDIHGEDSFQTVRSSYVRGTAGCLYIVDATRPETLDVALELAGRVVEQEGQVPGVLVLNKSDLESHWALEPDRIDALAADGWSVVRSSAKTGEGVEHAFQLLARKLLATDP